MCPGSRTRYLSTDGSKHSEMFRLENPYEKKEATCIQENNIAACREVGLPRKMTQDPSVGAAVNTGAKTWSLEATTLPGCPPHLQLMNFLHLPSAFKFDIPNRLHTSVFSDPFLRADVYLGIPHKGALSSLTTI
jgi:hypothetical protein